MRGAEASYDACCHQGGRGPTWRLSSDLFRLLWSTAMPMVGASFTEMPASYISHELCSALPCQPAYTLSCVITLSPL